MATFNFSLQQLNVLLFIFLRITSILFFLPLFDNKSIPALFKIGLSFVISILLIPLLKPSDMPDFTLGIPFAIGIATEIIMGVGIGLSVKLIFAGIQLGGQLVGYQMGLAIANVFDPSTGSQSSIIAQFKYMAAMLIFLSIDAHHWFFRAILESFVIIPPFGFKLNTSLIEYLIVLSGDMFVIAVKLSAPLIVAMLFTSVALGLVARTVPQMNVFFVAMPVKLFVGFIFIGLTLPAFSSFLVDIFNDTGKVITLLIRLAIR